MFRDRDLASVDYPYVFLDATYSKARVSHRVVSQAVVAAAGVASDGRREVLGFDVGDSENEGFWTVFTRSSKTRRLGGVSLVMSDAHSVLKKATNTVFQGSSWQRCRVHFMRSVLSVIREAPKTRSPRSSERSSPNPTRSMCRLSSMKSPACCSDPTPRSRPCSTRPATTYSRSPTSRKSIGARSGARTH